MRRFDDQPVAVFLMVGANFDAPALQP